MDENTQSGLDARAAKTLDGLNLTPRPKPAVQQEVSQDPFTDRDLSRRQRRRARDAESPTRLTQVARHAGVYLSSPLQNALNPTRLDYDGEFRRAWMNLDKQTRREIENHCMLLYARRSAGRQTLEDRVRGRRIHYGRAAEVSDYDVSAPASGRLTIYRSRPTAADIPAAADIYAAGTDTRADSRRLDTSVSAAAAADDTP